MSEHLSKDQALSLAEDYYSTSGVVSSTQDILDSGAIPQLKGFTVRPGKVSDSIVGGPVKYTAKDGAVVEFENPPLYDANGVPLRIMVRTSRISTHDQARGDIPFKDQILAANHNFMRRLLLLAIGSSQIDVPGLADTSVAIVAENLTQIPFENVLRAYMAKSTTTTSLYVHYMNGERTFCGHNLPEGLIPNGPLPYVMDTPSTKSDEHDESVSPGWLIENGVCMPSEYRQIRNSSLFAFGMVSEFLRNRGLIAVDTKTEHGRNSRGQIVSQDEIWTMDSSRFWLMDDYANQQEQLQRGAITELDPRSYSKEFARGFAKGKEGFTPEQQIQISARYIEGIQSLLGQPFKPDMRPHDERVVSALETIVEQVVR